MVLFTCLFFHFDSPGCILLCAQMFFSREQSSVRNTCVPCPWTKGGRLWWNIRKGVILLLQALSVYRKLYTLWFPSSYSLKVDVQMAQVGMWYLLGVLLLVCFLFLECSFCMAADVSERVKGYLARPWGFILLDANLKTWAYPPTLPFAWCVALACVSPLLQNANSLICVLG